QDRARKAGYSVFVADSDEDVDLEEEVIASIVKQVDGILLVSPRASAERILELVGSKPTVLLNRRIDGLPSLLLDNAAGVAQVLDHLQALGHRKIAYAASPMSSWSGTERIEAMHRQAES